MDDAESLLREAEDQIEAWLCDLDATWTRILAGARVEAVRIVAAARAEAASITADAARAVAAADHHAREIVARAEQESTSLLAGTARLARMQLAESEAEVVRARALAAESTATAEAIALAADAAATGRVQVDDLAALGSAVIRLRTELSRVVDAAFDALPAVEATAAALKLDEPAVERDPIATAPKRKAGFVRRLLRI